MSGIAGHITALLYVSESYCFGHQHSCVGQTVILKFLSVGQNVRCFSLRRTILRMGRTMSVTYRYSTVEMFRTSEVRCEVQKFVMKFTNQFVKLAFDWLLSNQSETLFTNQLVKFHCEFLSER